MNRSHYRLVAVLTSLLAAATVSCSSAPAELPTADPSQAPRASAVDEGVTPITLGSSVATQSPLSPDDAANLAYMREEEKLAHDVYAVLAERWSLRTFDNIASAESTHTAAVADLLQQFGLDDPAAGRPAGTFTDANLQLLYDELTARGTTSLVEALRVGALIEELDIADLRGRRSTSPAIQAVYDNLERGSRNHLRAFDRQLTRNGVTYAPQHLEPAEYRSIAASAMERGGGR